GQYNLIYNAALLVRSGTCFALTYKGLIQEDEDVVFRPLFPTLVDVNTLIWNKDQNLPNIGTLFIQKLKEKIDQKKNSNS
ncbi:MAG: LysR family transcriptional regulator, partial [Ligilactobacillus sp.]|nr:LysR family transcriptional regulator [Ligilactobacillus sp.]